MPTDSLTFRIIASCFNCQGSPRSEVGVSLICCTLGFKGTPPGPQITVIQRIISSKQCASSPFCILQRAVAGRRAFFFSCLASFNTSLKTEGLLNGLCLNVGKREGQVAEDRVCDISSPALLTPVSKRLVSASYLPTPFK